MSFASGAGGAAMSQSDCSICLEAVNERASIDGCEHHFCFGCITRWSSCATTCPLCKAPFSSIRSLEEDGCELIMCEEKLKIDDSHFDDVVYADSDESDDSEAEYDDVSDEEDRNFIVMDDEIDLIYGHEWDEDYSGPQGYGESPGSQLGDSSQPICCSDSDSYDENEDPGQISESELEFLQKRSFLDQRDSEQTLVGRVVSAVHRGLNWMAASPRRQSSPVASRLRRRRAVAVRSPIRRPLSPIAEPTSPVASRLRGRRARNVVGTRSPEWNWTTRSRSRRSGRS